MPTDDKAILSAKWVVSHCHLRTLCSYRVWSQVSEQMENYHSAGMEFFMEKTYRQYLVPHSPQKRFNPFLSSDAYFAPKMVMSPKNYFSRLFWNVFFFFERIVQWKIFKISFPTKKVILIFVTRCPLPPQNGHVLP